MYGGGSGGGGKTFEVAAVGEDSTETGQAAMSVGLGITDDNGVVTLEEDTGTSEVEVSAVTVSVAVAETSVRTARVSVRGERKRRETRDGWSGRMEDSILRGCIPVIIQHSHNRLSFSMENLKSYVQEMSDFVSNCCDGRVEREVGSREDEIPNFTKILKGFNDTEIESKLANVQRIWQRFLHRDSMLLEAERQEFVFGHMEDWAVQLSQLSEDDVFATLI
ncbi:hypothetical protein Cgig2_027613 [Carnegiea gigantea]|uniref:Uncharacterized protein n=1 Tax=Carnegiea gigantea TaxID=171969 RepID=A0A9Q1K714_9CARY|nr:hypothetical protein Cgig2_027613 [Carnegiea gigantea]